MASRRVLLAIVLLLGLGGCREADRPLGPVTSGPLLVDSDPAGAQIVVDGQATGRVTPDTLRQLEVGPHTITVRLERGAKVYGFSARVETMRDTALRVFGPLVLRCTAEPCWRALTTYQAPNRVRFATNPSGTLFFLNGIGGGLFWPTPSSNSYLSTGSPVFGGVVRGSGGAVALGPYDWEYLAGRPEPVLDGGSGSFRLEQSTWVLPPPATLPLRTVRGLAIHQELSTRPGLEDVVIVRLVFRNVSDRPSYRAMDPVVPAAGITYEDAYIGMALDADIGFSEDDLLSYSPADKLAFVYDSDFREPAFETEWVDRPGLVGVGVLEAPAGTRLVLTGWPKALEWRAGLGSTTGVREESGLRWLNGTHTAAPNHADPGIGYLPDRPEDLRAAVAAGPLRLAPGDSAVLKLAVVLAPPAPGSFTSGTVLAPGDPTDETRPLLKVAAPLLERARAAGSGGER
ncbi:MAG: PEGA domain-containing protein [Gemmatimonadetes bacterium]|nr:PEGA domain-containing protein [Gemmatimonadota bacterium]